MEFKRIVLIAVVLLILWGSFLWFAIIYAHELRSHPCNLCAEKVGEEVICTTYDGNTIKHFRINGSSMEEYRGYGGMGSLGNINITP